MSFLAPPPTIRSSRCCLALQLGAGDCERLLLNAWRRAPQGEHRSGFGLRSGGVLSVVSGSGCTLAC